MSYDLSWSLNCDYCANSSAGRDGAKFITEGDRFEFDRLYAENGYVERPDGTIMCPNHPRPVAS